MNDAIANLLPALAQKFKDDFRKSYNGMYEITFEEGQKYIRIVCDNGTQKSCNGFICMVNSKDGKFKVGDLLKCAGWKAPALNFPRGSIFDLNNANIRWTGIG